MSKESHQPDSEYESVQAVIGLGILVGSGTIIGALAYPDRIPSGGWAIMTGLFCYVLAGSIAVVWISLRSAKARADEIVIKMTEDETSKAPETESPTGQNTVSASEVGISKIRPHVPRLMDRYNDLGLPIWPFVYQRYLVAVFAAVIAILALLGLLAHWPSPTAGSDAAVNLPKPPSGNCGRVLQ